MFNPEIEVSLNEILTEEFEVATEDLERVVKMTPKELSEHFGNSQEFWENLKLHKGPN